MNVTSLAMVDALALDSYSTDGGGWLIPAAQINAHAAIRLIDDNDNAATRAARAWLKSQIFELELDMETPLGPLFTDSPQP